MGGGGETSRLLVHTALFILATYHSVARAAAAAAAGLACQNDSISSIFDYATAEPEVIGPLCGATVAALDLTSRPASLVLRPAETEFRFSSIEPKKIPQLFQRRIYRTNSQQMHKVVNIIKSVSFDVKTKK